MDKGFNNFSNTPDGVLQLLKEGNKRFLDSNFADKDYKGHLTATSNEQHPHTIIVTCSDSRVTPEIIFDETIGDLFVIRLAGNVIDNAAIGSIEYAVKYLKSSYLLILGHTHCGAVEATVSGGKYSPCITSIAERIMPAFEKVKERGVEEDKLLEETIEENVILQSGLVSERSKIISENIKTGNLKIGGAIYDVGTGQVRFLD